MDGKFSAAIGESPNTARPGRICPPHYGYSPKALARPAGIEAETLYVIGGLYGNRVALDAIETAAAHESVAPQLVFNGDFHWFDAEAELFAEVHRRVLAHHALRGNVETEIAGDASAVGCGCAYPESVPDDDVERSNRILYRLCGIACEVPRARTQLAALPMHGVAAVGGLRIGIVHGDAWSLAGWRFAHDGLHDSANDVSVARALDLAAVDGFACTHTCLPALRVYARGFVINNGAAGMASFAGSSAGLITRIGTRALPAALQAQRVYGLHERGVWIDALRIDFDLAAWLAIFDRLWSADSPAAISYRVRITQGPAFTPAQALGRAPAPSHCALAA